MADSDHPESVVNIGFLTSCCQSQLYHDALDNIWRCLACTGPVTKRGKSKRRRRPPPWNEAEMEVVEKRIRRQTAARPRGRPAAYADQEVEE